MAATQTVPQLTPVRNFPTELTPQHGVVTLYGYGIRVQVERGHLIIKDGIGPNRREGRYSRIENNLKRLVAIGSDGMISLAALRWLADRDAAFVMLDRNGSVLATTGPVRPSDARLRRTQALANESGIALLIVRELIDRKLCAQEQLVRTKLNDSPAADKIAEARIAVFHAPTIERVRNLEAKAGFAYWSAWRNIPINFPSRDIRRVPDHWRTFTSRVSPLTGSPRLATNPANAMLNYLYAVLESEARLAVAAQGLDPGLGVLHFDRPNRDSLACDVMEPARPQVDAYVLDWIQKQPLKREWFFEQRDGACRLMGTFASRLSETAPSLAQAVAPMTEWIARKLWLTLPNRNKNYSPATRLTQSHRRQAKGGLAYPAVKLGPAPQATCTRCGAEIPSRHKNCGACAKVFARRGLIKAAKLGRIATHLPQAKALRAETMRRQMAGRTAWKPSDLPDWLDKNAYRHAIHPKLAGLTVSLISRELGISEPYATTVRSGKRIPHPRHWEMLARIAGISEAKLGGSA
jgi:CRISPR-associated endonuclease Cas1